MRRTKPIDPNTHRRRHAPSLSGRSTPVRDVHSSRRTESFIASSLPSANLCISRRRRVRSFRGQPCGVLFTRRVHRHCPLVRPERRESFVRLATSVRSARQTFRKERVRRVISERLRELMLPVSSRSEEKLVRQHVRPRDLVRQRFSRRLVVDKLLDYSFLLFRLSRAIFLAWGLRNMI